jgi:hypothetical protein
MKRLCINDRFWMTAARCWVHSTFLGNLFRFLNLNPNLNLQRQEGGIKIKIRIKIKRGTQKYEMHPALLLAQNIA